jgi:hypothetical protein
MITQADAPSENWLALPAAMTPPGVAGRIFEMACCRIRANSFCPRRS